MKITRADVIDKLDDFYGITQDDLTPRELAIIGLCARDLFEEEIELLDNFKASEEPSNCILGDVRQSALSWWNSLTHMQKMIIRKSVFHLENKKLEYFDEEDMQYLYDHWHFV